MSLPVPSLKCPVCAVSHTPVPGPLKNGVYAGTCQSCGFFFKFRALQDSADTITFTVNGASYTVGNEFHPATSLSEWLRSQNVSMGTKQLCQEGGCGVCLVAVKLYEPVSFTNQTYAANACLMPLYSCEGLAITTIEGLGSVGKGLHSIQQRLLQYNGSQCGFCSPAQVINMYGLLQRNPTPTTQEVEDNFDASICRCTGYRPILDAMKSFAVDAPPTLPGGPIDIEDLNPKLCQRSGQPCKGQCGKGPNSAHGSCGQGNANSKKEKEEEEEERRRRQQRGSGGQAVPVHIVSQRAQWFKPTTLEALYALLKQYRDANYRLVFGNTGYGVYKELGTWMYDILIDLRGVKAMYGIDFDPVVVLGANLSLSNLLELFERAGSDPALQAYCPDFAAHMKQVGSNPIRNVASWAGSLMLKHKHPDFISDIYTMFETIGTKLFIVDGDGNEQQVTLTEFMAMDMKGKVIIAAALPTYTSGDIYIRTFRVAQRLQLCHGYVLAGFNFQMDKDDNFLIKARPSLIFQGIDANTNHALKTEAYLNGKQLGDPQVLKTAMEILREELTPASDPALASPLYRHNLACALFYKFVLGACSTQAGERYHSGAVSLARPVSSARQSFSTDKQQWPLNEPITKMVAGYQVAGESRFLDDQPLAKTELYASFVISNQGNAHVTSIDASAALAMAGVYRLVQASDIPAGGKNSMMPASTSPWPEELFCSGQVQYAGQPLALIVADDPQTADTAAAKVRVTYSQVQTPVTDLLQAIRLQSFFPSTAAPPPVVVGNPDQALAQSAHRIRGTIQMGTQAHFSLETQVSRCAPSDDGGMNVQTTTQWIDAAAEVVAAILNIPQSSVTMEVKRLGGAFGCKISRNFMVTGACALAARVMQRPVRVRMNLHTNLKAIGKRFPYYAEYEVGCSEEGKLAAISILIYADCGATPNDSSMALMFNHLDNAYQCPNWKVTFVAVKTNKAANTYCRSPGSLPAQFMMETMMEHLAAALHKDPSQLRHLNFYQKGQVTPAGMRLDYCNIGPLVTQLETGCDLATRKSQVDLFNQANRWKKRGLSMVPTMFGVNWAWPRYNVHVVIYHADATIAIQHGGIEVGQGINTKTAQVCAYELGVPLSLVRVKKGSSVGNANSTTTGGTITSELNAEGVLQCCRTLKARMDPVRQQMGNPSWQDLVTECFKQGLDLSAQCYVVPHQSASFRYYVYGATVTEAEVDVLTGQSQIIRADMLYDCGESLNPELDLGQVEGGFVMGLGYHLTEKEKFHPDTGELITDGTWEYKPPMPKDLPIDFRVSLLKNAPTPLGVLRSKTAGEPPLVMASSALFAIKHAIAAARAEAGNTDYFTLNSPALVEDIQTACLVSPSQFTYGQ